MSDQDDLDELLGQMPDPMKQHLTAQVRVDLAKSLATLRDSIPEGADLSQEVLEAFALAMGAWFNIGWAAGATDAAAQAIEQGVDVRITGGPTPAT